MKPSYRLLALAVFSGAIGAALLLSFWRQKNELAELRASNAELAARIEQKASDPTSGSTGKNTETESARATAKASTVAARPRPVVTPRMTTDSTNEMEVSQSIPKTKGPKPWQGEVLTINKPETKETFTLSEASAKPVADGLVATMKFNSTSNTPMEEFALVVRLPKRSDVKILNLEPADPATFTDASTQVHPNGKFVIFRGTSKTTGNTTFNLALSGPETVDVRGTGGMKPFLLQVDSSSATIRDYPTN
ncbi:MAG: hypothetical protein WCO77_03410 [bacterium]